MSSIGLFAAATELFVAVHKRPSHLDAALSVQLIDNASQILGRFTGYVEGTKHLSSMCKVLHYVASRPANVHLDPNQTQQVPEMFAAFPENVNWNELFPEAFASSFGPIDTNASGLPTPNSSTIAGHITNTASNDWSEILKQFAQANDSSN